MKMGNGKLREWQFFCKERLVSGKRLEMMLQKCL